jgi:hypothetical protein
VATTAIVRRLLEANVGEAAAGALDEGLPPTRSSAGGAPPGSRATAPPSQPFPVGPGAMRAATEGASSLSLSTADSWGNPATLARHFADHGADFGATSADDYASRASQFLQRSQAESLPTKVDHNGVIRTYDPATSEFGSFNASGTTRTYFAPDPAVHGYATNWDYWLSQVGVEPWTP